MLSLSYFQLSDVVLNHGLFCLEVPFNAAYSLYLQNQKTHRDSNRVIAHPRVSLSIFFMCFSCSTSHCDVMSLQLVACHVCCFRYCRWRRHSVHARVCGQWLCYVHAPLFGDSDDNQTVLCDFYAWRSWLGLLRGRRCHAYPFVSCSLFHSCTSA